ncbi:acyl-CoA synthetase [Pseudorhodoferax sp. Leaf267]|uniref:LpxL/LpxP family acyltransferase n=1 Tax=Pseudorhodoferax sp. Leaf267 TaxID=1736316 RepID=UPI0006FC5362|nr:acyl-CoA synthetase [Pseudorhodoferax sp. Leaf267]KQP11844.1 acyl-CoA synthetase [Pseudorhodoferax sp. Leaf267]
MTAPAQPPADWATQRERSNLWVLKLMGAIAVYAGRPIARGVLHPIALYFLLANGPARRASRQYLTRALGRPAGWRDSYRHIHSFAATVLDRVYFLQGRLAHFHIENHNVPQVEAVLAEGQGVMLLGAHLGSFEALRAGAESIGTRAAMLMYEDNARLINATLKALAPGVQLHTIALGRPGAMLALRRWLADGGMAGLLADRILPGHSGRSRTWMLPFLGRPAPFSDGPLRLAAMLRQRVFFMAGLYHGGGRYSLRFEPLADFRDVAGATMDAEVQAALERYVALLETLCREAPCNWFNFYDFWASDDDAKTA